MAPKEQPQETTKQEEDEVASNSTDYDDIDTVEKWHGLVRAIEATTRERFPASPPVDGASFSDFQQYWRDTFTQLSSSISSNADIPYFLTSPPTRKFFIFLFDVDQQGCPCCLPETEPNVVLENEDGVTKDDFMKGFVEYMYGASLPRIHREDGSTADEPTCALVHASDWMSQGKNADGEKFALVQMVAPKDRVPDIWLYCLDPKEYPAKIDKVKGGKV